MMKGKEGTALVLDARAMATGRCRSGQPLVIKPGEGLMYSTRTGILWIGVLLVIAMSAAAGEWNPRLCQDGGGIWRQRMPITVTNPTDQVLKGYPVSLAVGESATPLAGVPAQSVRVCDSAGQEMLFAITDAQGLLVSRGPIPAGGALTLPAECGPRQSATYYAYFQNASAGELADFLEARGALVNGDLESGHGRTPTGWKHDENDETHQARWSDERPQSGKRCLKTVVASGAEPSWISTRQSDVRIRGGARYVLSAWVRGKDVKGQAGWYIHLGNQENPMLKSPLLVAGEGTFDWKQVTARFTAPEQANQADLGTVLRGTGTAWFDHVSLECLDPDVVRAVAGPAERLELHEVGALPPWPATAGHRAEIKIVNLAREPVKGSQACLDMAMLQARARGHVDLSSLRLVSSGAEVPVVPLADRLLFPVNVPPLTVQTAYLDFSAGPSSKGSSSNRPRNARPLPIEARFNLVRNQGFEASAQLPESWTSSGSNESEGVSLGLDNPHRADLGQQCLRMHVPDTAPAGWRGWHQDVPVRPGHTYLVAAELKCQDVKTGEVRVHIHFQQADGALCRQDAMTSIGPGVRETTDWTLVSGTLTAPADAATLQIHLTMEQSGTVWHDAVLVTEVTSASLTRFLHRPDTENVVRLWQVPAVVKVFPDDDPPHRIAPARIAVARNEREPLQLAVLSRIDRKNVRVVVDPPVGQAGARLAPWETGVVGYVPVDHATGYYQSKSPAWHRKTPGSAGQSDGWPGLWPDPILPRDSVDLSPGVTQPIWITFSIAPGAPAGDYHGSVKLVANRETIASLPFTVHVWKFNLPDGSHLKAIYDIGLGPGGEALWGKSNAEAYPEIARTMAQQRVCPNQVHPDPSFRYEHGRASADFTAFDKAARVYFDELKFPHAYMPNQFYLFGWGFPPKHIFGEHPFPGDPPFDKADRSRLRPEYKRAYQACLKLFWDHLREKGWQDRFVLYISDEPFYQQERIRRQMVALCAMIHEVDPRIPIYSSTWRHVPEWDGSLDIWGIGHYGEVSAATMNQIRARGAKIWFTTDGQMCLDTPYCAIERLLPHYAFRYGAEAYEFWGIAWLTHDPYRFGWHAYIDQTDQPGQSYWIRYPNGDGFLLYPGKPIGHAGPVRSIRLEQAREGLEDYEYLELLRSLASRAKSANKDTSRARRAFEEADRLVPIPSAGGRYSTKILPDPEALYRVRQEVAEAIEELSR
jgi:Glycoside hydrolase 123, catalytic domain/Carbohydrate binding domain